jgi:hypothetical protein
MSTARAFNVILNYQFTQADITLNTNTLETVTKYFDTMHADFVDKAQLVHRKSLFQILRYLIRICPVDTGRLRGSFTPFMDKYGDTTYNKWMADASMAPSQRKTPKKGFNQEAVADGKAQGQFIDQPMDTTIVTNVSYAEDADKKSGYISRLMAYADNQYNKNFSNFLEAAAKKGLIPAVDPSAESDEGGV